MPRLRSSVLALVAVALVGLTAATPASMAQAHHPRGARRASVAGEAALLCAGPSCEAMPTVAPPGWRLAFSDDFTSPGAPNPGLWRVYRGQPTGDPGGVWDPSHIWQTGGELVISGFRDAHDGNRWATGGMMVTPTHSQTYGTYLVRFRMDSGEGIAHAILLWPTDNSWPPEIDFSEDNGAAPRDALTTTLHYGANNTKITDWMKVDLTQWHTLGVQWTPGQIIYTIDGRDWATVANANVPNIAMSLAIQTQAWSCGTNAWEVCPSSHTPSHVNMDVDWVVAYTMQ